MGSSLVAAQFESSRRERTHPRLPESGRESPSYFCVPLRDYDPVAVPVQLNQFVERHAAALRREATLSPPTQTGFESPSARLYTGNFLVSAAVHNMVDFSREPAGTSVRDRAQIKGKTIPFNLRPVSYRDSRYFSR